MNRIIFRTKWYNEEFWKGTTKFWNMRSCDYSIVNLGSNSGKHAFNYDRLPVKGMNWAVGPQSLVHDFNILKNYFSYLKEGGIVLIPVCPFSCLHTSYSKESNFKYYPMLHPATIMHFDDTERTRAFRIRLNPFKEMPTYCMKKTLKEFLHKVCNKRPPKIDFDKNAKVLVNSWKSQFGINDLNEPLTESHKKELVGRAEILREMIVFCQERNLRPYIVLPPVHPAMSSLLDERFLYNYVYDFIFKATDDKSIILDHFNDKAYHKDEYFLTSFYMNEHGASIFTGRILKDLGLIKKQ